MTGENTNDAMRYDDLDLDYKKWTFRDRDSELTPENIPLKQCSECYCHCLCDHRQPELRSGGCGEAEDDVRFTGGIKAVDRVKGCCCSKDWVDFTESTTLHGLRYIWQRHSLWARRLIWLVLTLTCLGLMLYQILDRVIYYHDLPITVNVKINYNNSLSFPSVTMCNQNAFRASAAQAIGRYSLITEMFTDHMTFNASDLERYNASDITMEELYREAGHRKEDLIVRCEWRGEKCGPENFTEIGTDHGKCFTFNYAGDSSSMFVNTPGSEDGLSLTLNIEQYEYMPGPQDAAGVKILLHHPHQFPQVKGLGLVLPAGSHAFIGAKMLGVKNLPAPHGQCSSPRLRHFRHYSAETCDVECKAKLLKKVCGCRRHYMPDEETPVCTLRQLYECYKPNINQIRSMVRTHCDCPVPCEILVFNTDVSYANTSPLAAHRFLAYANRSALKASYDVARDVTHRLQEEKRDLLAQLTDDLEEQLTTVRDLLVTDIEDRLQSQKTTLDRENKTLYKTYRRAMYLYQYQRFIVDKDFIRARDAMNERTLSVVHLAMQEYKYRVESAIHDLVNETIVSDEVRTAIFFQVKRLLEARIDIIARAKQNYTQFHEGLVKGEPIFNYRYKRERRKYSPLIVPVPLFHDIVNKTKTIRKRVQFMGENLDNLQKQLEIAKSLAISAYESGTLNKTFLHLELVQFLYWCREYSQSKDMFMYDVPDLITEKLLKREAILQHLWTRFSIAADDSKSQADNLLDRLQHMKHGMLESLTIGLNLSKSFLSDGQPSKKVVAAQFLKEEILEKQASLKTFFSEIRSRGQALFDDWLELERSCKEIWTRAVDDVNLQTYYKARKVATFLINSTAKVEQISDDFGRYRRDLDLRHLVGHVEAEFIKALTSMLSEMRGFKDTEGINGLFMQQNILRVNIFYRELNYEQITQQEAYDIFALLCDIGGSMGLFLGASVITIFELLDLFFFSYFVRNRSAVSHR